MEVTYELDRKDIVAFQRHHYRTAPAMRRSMHVSTLLFGTPFVFITPQSAVIVPKRAFLDARQAAEFYGAAERFHEGARAGVPRPNAAEIERAARLDGRPASQFDERHLSPVERVFSE